LYEDLDLRFEHDFFDSKDLTLGVGINFSYATTNKPENLVVISFTFDWGYSSEVDDSNWVT